MHFDCVVYIVALYMFECVHSTVNTFKPNHTLTYLQQIYYTLETIKRLDNPFMQLCTP